MAAAESTTVVRIAAQVGYGNATVHRAIGESDRPERGFYTLCGAEMRAMSSAVREVEATNYTCKRCGVGPVRKVSA